MQQNTKPKLTEITNTPKTNKTVKRIPIEETRFCRITRNCDLESLDVSSEVDVQVFEEPENCVSVPDSDIFDLRLDNEGSDELFEKIKLDFSDLLYKKKFF